MIVLMLTVIIFQVRSFSAMFMVVLTAPLGLAGVVPTLLLFHQPFGFNAILGLIALAGILMRNTLILIGQIKTNQEEGLDSYHAVVEATVQRSRPVILTALAAVLMYHNAPERKTFMDPRLEVASTATFETYVWLDKAISEGRPDVHRVERMGVLLISARP